MNLSDAGNSVETVETTPGRKLHSGSHAASRSIMDIYLTIICLKWKTGVELAGGMEELLLEPSLRGPAGNLPGRLWKRLGRRKYFQILVQLSDQTRSGLKGFESQRSHDSNLR